jgi:DNA-binding PadR family transcriptional regulator
MRNGTALGPFQQQVLYVLLRLGEKAYGTSIWQELEERTGEAKTIGAVYSTLERLERRGFVSSRMGDPTPERGGRAKRYYSITGAGASALQESERVVRSLQGLVPELGGGS